jgi:hypothetical protein
MNIDNLISDLNTNSIVCYKTLHSGKCEAYCKYYKGHDSSVYINIDEGNISRIPCRFLLKDSGCKDKETACKTINWNWREPDPDPKPEPESCIMSDKFYECCKHNHFYKPQYICPAYLYNTSLNTSEEDKHLPECDSCGKLHMSWNNYGKNMLNSRVEKERKSRSIDFLVNIIFNLTAKSEYNKTVFDDLIKLHQTYREILTKLEVAYNSKCIKCTLPPHKPKLKAPREITVWALQNMKKCLPFDIIRVVSTYMYDTHDYHPNGCTDCIFMIERPTYTISDKLCYEIYNLSKVSGYGERAVTSNAPKFICICKNGELRTINDCSIDNYTDKNRDAVLKIITNKLSTSKQDEDLCSS